MKKKNEPLSGQKNFYFQDYDYSENIKKPIISGIDVSFNRVSFVFFVFVIIALIYSLKIVYLASIDNENYFVNNSYTKSIKTRQDIVDRNGNILAKTVTFYDAAIRPELILDKKKLLINLKMIFPSLDIRDIRKKMNDEKYFYIKRKIKNIEKNKLWLLGDKSISLDPRPGRIYPHKALFSHVIGQTDDKNLGISGIEKKFDDYLKSSDNPLSLTLDSNLQFLIREELLKANEIFNSIGSAALLMNAENGEVLSLVSLPDFDLNARSKIDDPIYLNKITKGVYELGSVFKTFTIAAGLETEKIKPNTIFTNLPKKIICGRKSISEYNNKIPQNLSAEQILIRSSNIGAIKIAQMVGSEKLKNFYKTLELFDRINFELEEVGTPLPIKWENCTLETASYGHGITTTPLQLGKAYAVLVNGGYKINPTLINNKFINEKKEQIISKKTSNYIKNILRQVVSKEEGTANFAEIPGYDVAGKTGTAEKYNSEKQINTFVSFFPSNDPKYILVVLLDEPQAATEYVYTFKFQNNYKGSGYEYNTAGWNSVVVAGKIIEKIGPILAINNLQASINF